MMAEQKGSLILLGIILMLSTFAYTVVDLGVGTVEDETEAYFERYNQEDFSLYMSPYLLPSDREQLDDGCPFTLSIGALYKADKPCFYSLVEAREAALDDFGEATLETRFYKDGVINKNDSVHDLRVFLPAKTINQTYLEAGKMPQGPGEIAVLSNYATHNNLSIGDDIESEGQTHTITGFILLPDFNLPVISHPLFFLSDTQTLGVMDSAGFEAYGGAIETHVSGVFETEEYALDDYSEDERFMHGIHTRNNMRSGAVYAEIEGSRGASLAISVLIASIGIVVVGLMLKNTIERSKRPFGVLKSLGLTFKEMALPFIGLVMGFAGVFLLAGYGLGYLGAPFLKSFFLSVYLLPEGDIGFSGSGFVIALLVPFLIVVVMTVIIARRLLNKEALELMRPLSKVSSNIRLKTLRKLFKKAGFLRRFQLAFFSRNLLKSLIFTVGIVFAAFLALLAFSMDGIFDETLTAFYEDNAITHTAYMEGAFDAPSEGERAIEIDGTLHDTQALLVGLDADQTLQPLKDSDDNDLLGRLEDGVVISESFALLSGLSQGEMAALSVYGTTRDVEIVGVADMYPGTHVFTDRATLAEWVVDDANFYNALYNDGPFNELYDTVVETERILESTHTINSLIMRTIYVMIFAALFIGAIIMILMSTLTVGDNAYTIALLKVLGYHDKEIGTMILGAYHKLAALGLILAVPLSVGSFEIMVWFFAEYYGLVWPMTIGASQVFIIFILYGMIYVGATWRAKAKINRVSLQSALKIYQD